MPAHACMRTRAPPLAAAAAGRRRRRRRSGLGLGLCLGLGLGSGSGSLPGLVLFESGLQVWVESLPLRYPNRTRSAIQIRTDPPTENCWNTNSCDCRTTNSCDCWVRQLDSQLLGRKVATFRWVQTRWSPWSAINSAPISQLKYTNYNTNNSALSHSQSSEVISELAVEF